MSAVFTNLHDVAQLLAELIADATGVDDVQPGAPRDATATVDAAVRITLLYVTPQPGHRNDPQQRGPDGRRSFPPLSLSCFYLVTASGADGDDPIAAHRTLGQVMTLFHDDATLAVPDTGQGAGSLSVVQVPIALDQIDKIWTSLDAQLQPWVLFEVAPVQLVSTRAGTAPGPVVVPGGVRLDVRAGTRPVLVRVTPEAVRPGGQVRIDTVLTGALDGLSVGGIDVPAGDGSLNAAPDGSAVLLRLDDGGLETLGTGAHALVVRASGLFSQRGTLRVVDATAAAVDAPALTHDPATDLVLAGANLGTAQEAMIWPDSGITAPTDIRTMPLGNVAAGSVTIASAGLATLPADRGTWRLTVRTTTGVFTPHVLLELAS